MPVKIRLKGIRATWRQQVLAVPAPVPMSTSSNYSLTQAPQQPLNVTFALNGLVLRQTTDYTVSGSTVTYLGGQALTTSDYFIAAYISED